jgi:hypothetical protein
MEYVGGERVEEAAFSEVERPRNPDRPRDGVLFFEVKFGRTDAPKNEHRRI